MMAADAQTVADLNAKARADRVTAGDVNADGVLAADGSNIGVGNVVVTRQNQRTLATAGAWVKNGDRWIVTPIQDHGSMQVRRPVGGGAAVLPPAYVREHVELGYAFTAHRAQGRTVDTAHTFVTATTVREPLYVMATRGRESNRLYVDTRYDPDSETSHEQPVEVRPVDVLTRVLVRSGGRQVGHRDPPLRARRRRQGSALRSSGLCCSTRCSPLSGACVKILQVTFRRRPNRCKPDGGAM